MSGNEEQQHLKNNLFKVIVNCMQLDGLVLGRAILCARFAHVCQCPESLDADNTLKEVKSIGIAPLRLAFRPSSLQTMA